MKKFLLLLTCFLVFKVKAQVGINTTEPTRTLHVNGNLRVGDLEDKSKDLSYSKILVANDEGDIDYLTDEVLLPENDDFTSDKEVFNSIYSSELGGPDDTKFVTCGKFDFKFANNGKIYSNVQLRLNEPPLSDLNMFLSIEQSWDNGMEFSAYTTPMTFSAGNSDFINLPYGPGIVDFELNVIYLLYPGETDLYRVTFYRVKQSTMGANFRDYTIACEKF